MASLATGWLTDVDGNKLYAWSHAQRVRINDTTNLQEYLEALNNKINSEEGKLNENDVRKFIKDNYKMSTLYDTDGKTPIGFTLD